MQTLRRPVVARVPWAVVLVAVVAACYRVPARNRPLSGSLETTTPKTVGQATQAAAATLAGEGLPIEQFRQDTGLVESAWFDIALLEPSARDYPSDERMVRWRFLAIADTTAGLTRIYLETLQALTVDALGSRRRERLVPRDHPALAVSRRLMERLADRLSELQ